MESLYVWPDNPALSLFALWLLSAVILWAAREPMLQMIRGLGKGMESGFESVVSWCRSAAEGLQKRSRETLLAAGELELQSKMDREVQRIDLSFSEKVGQYATLHRKLDDMLMQLDDDYKKCGDSPPEVPGWSGAVEAVSVIPNSSDPSVKKVLEGIRDSMKDAEKKALDTYREDTSKRHKILSRMRPDWKEVKDLMARMTSSVTSVVQTSSKIQRYVDDYEKIVKKREAAAHSLTYSAMKPFVISLIVMGVALGGAFINFQLIALPMSELVPDGARIGGLPVSTVSALVLVLMEAAVGIFLMDMLGITDLFPKLASIAPSRRRLILGLSLAGLFFLAAVESSLAILREQIVEADTALKASLAAGGNQVVAGPTTSKIPVIGQAVLGFVLPWILAMVAIPLEMLLDSVRHVAASVVVLLLQGLGHAVQIVAAVIRYLTTALPALYDVYVAIPLRIERMVRSGSSGGRVTTPATTAERRIRDAGVA